jgi:hypothetical protein
MGGDEDDEVLPVPTIDCWWFSERTRMDDAWVYIRSVRDGIGQKIVFLWAFTSMIESKMGTGGE